MGPVLPVGSFRSALDSGWNPTPGPRHSRLPLGLRRVLPHDRDHNGLVAVTATAAGRLARAWVGRRLRASDGDLVPDTARKVEAVARGLAGGRVALVRVERVTVEGRLQRSVRPGNRPEGALDTRPGGSRSRQRWPQAGARPVALGGRARVR